MAVTHQAPAADRGFERWLATGEVRHLRQHSPPLPQKRATPGRTGPNVAKANKSHGDAGNLAPCHAAVNTRERMGS